MEKSNCNTILRYDKNGEPVYKLKIKHETLEAAIKCCKLENVKPTQIRKLVAYKCSVCHKYHIGRGKTMVTDKYRAKLKKELSEIKFKIVGNINLK